MKFGFRLILIVLALTQGTSLASVRYSYVASDMSNLFLLGADGRTRATLAKGNGQDYWGACAVSPRSGIIVAELCRDGACAQSTLFRVDARMGSKAAIPGAKGFHIPECPVWLNDSELLVDRIDNDGLDRGVFSLNVRTGKTKLVIRPLPHNEFFYEPYIPSPTGRYVLTTLCITGGSWLSVNDSVLGKGLWRTNPEEGMVGFAGVAWSGDERQIYVAFYKDDELASSSPGGLWRFDAMTGKQHPWKYSKESLDGVFSAPKQNVLVVERTNSIDCLRMSDGRRLSTLTYSTVGGVLGAFSLSRDRWLLCGSRLVLEMDSSCKRLRTLHARGLSSSSVRYSPTRNTLMFGGVSYDGASDVKAGVLDLRTGRVTRFAANNWRIEWLPKDVRR